jgi:hypothetical protein
MKNASYAMKLHTKPRIIEIELNKKKPKKKGLLKSKSPRSITL